MKRLIYLAGIVVGVGMAEAQEPSSLFEPVSALFYLNLSALNSVLQENDFPTISSPINMMGSWTRVRALKWLPLGLSLAEGSLGAQRDRRRVRLTLFYFSAFVDQRWPLLEAVPSLQGFVSGGFGVGTATLLLGQRAITEETLESVLQTAHDTLLRRVFLSVVPRVGVEFTLTDVITLRASFGYIWSFWSSEWEHFAERVSGPPKDFSGVLAEFTISYRPN